MEYASWAHRAGGFLLDLLVTALAAAPLVIGFFAVSGNLDLREDPVTGNTTIGPDANLDLLTVTVLVGGTALYLGTIAWNLAWRQGRTGASLGKSAVGLRLLHDRTGEPPGAGLCLLRLFAHYVDSLICYLGWLWPLWDRKRQTLADKMCGTVVVVDRGRPTD